MNRSSKNFYSLRKMNCKFCVKVSSLKYEKESNEPWLGGEQGGIATMTSKYCIKDKINN